MLPLTLADISGQGIIRGLILLVVVALIAWLLWWFIDFAGLPEPFRKVARVLVALVVVVFLIDALLSIAGGGFIRWHD